ncbi:hypothetical protein FGG08_005684 [Glutinoglossum americanum]|uniref:Uncharacterized protein n=1 Tax=Glutinoglossum americanum TaxID=1670608 RepID=A0A9P8HU14_9PEZI|nr:hypothetical protein FGG08_005684 [Glutinoglossum americanum]
MASPNFLREYAGQASVYLGEPPPPERQESGLLQGGAIGKRRRPDIWSLIILLGTWIALVLSTLTIWGHSGKGNALSFGEVDLAFRSSLLPGLVAAILNEVLLDRSWRRITREVLRGPMSANRLRAANFSWPSYLKRAFLCRLSLEELKSLGSYILLRWGTVVSQATVQLVVEFHTDKKGYRATTRGFWFVGAVLLHALSLTLSFGIWRMPLWALFSSTCGEHGLIEAYQPYLDRVPSGSIATSDEVADYLDKVGLTALNDSPEAQASVLSGRHSPGKQGMVKVRGVSLGVALALIIPSLLLVYVKRMSGNSIKARADVRFVILSGFLATYTAYLFAFDFIIWTISLEGLCKTPKTKPRRGTNHLNSISGVMLVIKMAKSVWRRRPARAPMMFILFWVQCVLMRGIAVIISFDFKGGERGDFVADCMIWMFVGWPILLLPLLVWVFVPFRAPLCRLDGWRWAKIAKDALYIEGNYGIRDSKAVWGADVKPFENGVFE